MNDITVRTLEMFDRVVGFLAGDPIVFRKGSQGPQLVDQFRRTIDEFRELAARQLSEIAVARANSDGRAAARQALRDELEAISASARGLAVTMPEFEKRFRVTLHVGDAKLLSRARAIAVDAEPLRAFFVKFEMPSTFVDDLNSSIAAFEKAVGEHSASRGKHVATRVLVEDAMQRSLSILDQLDPIVAIKLKGKLGMQRQWKNARHVERAWVTKGKRKPVPPEPVTPTPAEPSPPAATDIAA